MSNTIFENNKRIVKNTLLLYFRMIITMCIGVYTSRIVLQYLGVIDYGINNVVAGMVTMFTFFNTTLASGTQRYITFALGEGNQNTIKLTFSTTFVVHLFLAIILSFMILIGGLWFMNGHLSIPVDRMDAAYWVFFCSIISIFLSITQVPYMSTLIAYENMGVYAYMAIYDALAKLIVAFSLIFSTIDNLKLYAVLNLIINITSILIYRIYCIKKYSECRVLWKVDIPLLKSILGFSGWNVFGCAAVMLNNHGINILLNVLFGPVINAARGISNTLNGMVMQLVGNFLTAANPQIVKYHANHEDEKMFQLINNTSRYSGLLFLLVLIPLCFETEFILKLWLGNVPDDAVFFTRVILIESLVKTMSRPIIRGIHAEGKLKWYSIISGSILLSIVPVSWLLLTNGVSVYVVLIINIIPWILETIITGIILGYYTGFSTIKYFKYVYCNVFPIGLFASLPVFLICYFIEDCIARFFIVSAISVIFLCILIYFWGLNTTMQGLIRDRLKYACQKICMRN